MTDLQLAFFFSQSNLETQRHLPKGAEKQYDFYGQLVRDDAATYRGILETIL